MKSTQSPLPRKDVLAVKRNGDPDIYGIEQSCLTKIGRRDAPQIASWLLSAWDALEAIASGQFDAEAAKIIAEHALLGARGANL